MSEDNGASFIHYDPSPEELKERRRKQLKDDLVNEGLRFLRSAFVTVGIFSVLLTVLSFHVANEQWKDAQSMFNRCVYTNPTNGGP